MIREAFDRPQVLLFGGHHRLRESSMVGIACDGIVTLATFTCQPREAVIGRRQENQWLGVENNLNPVWPENRILCQQSP